MVEGLNAEVSRFKAQSHKDLEEVFRLAGLWEAEKEEVLRLWDLLEAEKREVQRLKEELALNKKTMEEVKASGELERASQLVKAQKELHVVASKYATERKAQLMVAMDEVIVKYKQSVA